MPQNVIFMACRCIRLLQLNLQKRKRKKNNKVVEKTVSGTPAIIHENAALPSIVAYQV